MEQSYVYILSNKPQGTLYVGVTSDLIKRIYQHKSKFVDSFTSKYHLKLLVYYEIHNDIIEAIKKEKQLKRWRRDWKIKLIEKSNPKWGDLYGNIVG
jgi:putative endonuclease